MCLRSKHTLFCPLAQIKICCDSYAFLIIEHLSQHFRKTSSNSSMVISFNDGSLFAQNIIFVPRLSSSRANGNIPNIKSTPLLSTNMTAQLCDGPYLK